MEQNPNIPSEQALLQEYREAMESQRSNTNIAYSWIGSINLILSTSLFYYGTKIKTLSTFIPTMLLALVLVLVWWGMTETYIFYIKQRMARILQIEAILNLKLMSEAGAQIKSMGWKAKFLEARTYVRILIVSYIFVWLLLSYLKFVAI
jgi:hypothetical protein